MLHSKLISLLILFNITIAGYGLTYEYSKSINWSGVKTFNEDGYSKKFITFDGSQIIGKESLPAFVEKFFIHTSNANVEASISNMIFVPASVLESELLDNAKFVNDEILVNASIVISRKEPMAQVSFIPIRWNEKLSIYEKLVSFDLEIDVKDTERENSTMKEYASSSVLSSGNWYKIKLNKSGIYRITYQELLAMDFNVDVDPSNIALFGNGGGLLPEKNDDFRYDDLYENPIKVFGGEDGSFDAGDYFIFYGEGPVTWDFNSSDGVFNHNTNYYKDYSYYFISTVDYQAKRIEDIVPVTGSPDIEVSDFTDYAVHEVDERNIAGIGRTWYGEIYDYLTQYDFVFDFPNLKTNVKDIYFRGKYAARAYSSNAFKIIINGNQEQIVNVQPLNTGNRYEYAKKAENDFLFSSSSDQINVTTEYIRTSNTSVGYLDFIEINAQRDLKFTGEQMLFRKFLEDANIAEYTLANAGPGVTVWDVTIPVNPFKISPIIQGSSSVFKSDATEIREFIAFNGESFLRAEFVEQVANQNLHSFRNIDYLIVTHENFLDQANRLANFHRDNTDLSVLVVTVNQVYNEFSSGGQDITAIRDFAKLLYDDSDPGRELKYMLFFGDASYDYKNILPDNTNYVPCWESISSLDIVSSIATDDYFGFLDDGEGQEFANDLVDVGIGRFVVATEEESSASVDKTIHYSVNTTKVMAPWRNNVTFIADDGDANRHLEDAEKLAAIFDSSFQVYNINKIYVDAYEQISTPSGQAAPAVNAAINERIDKGSLIMNYSGHGGEIGLGHERFLQIPDIQSWTNYDKLSVFITATCEFTRYDDPNRVSAGEMVFLNDKGGAISLFTTSRATFAGSNLALNRAIYLNNMFNKVDGQYPTFGDIIRKSKLYGTSNDKKFILIGDPACRMAYPQYTAETIKVNSNVVAPMEYDTLRALQLVKIEGIITDEDGTQLNDFNGELFTSVFDKKSEVATLGDEGSPFTFFVRNSIIFNGKASITNGNFTFEFMLPKDIAYKYGSGKISYYFMDSVTDGNGYYENIIVGGFDEGAKEDSQGPDITLFMNDTTFTSGGITNENPNLLAYVSDSSGINTTGNGIGHDIITEINGDKELVFVLNDYYEADENKYNQGKIIYPFSNLPEGEHSLSLKVWDVYNNSSIAFLDFVVVTSENVIIENLMNYPNPFINETNFVFNHNQSGNQLEVQIEIFSVNGQLVKKINETLNPEGHRSEPINWNGKKDNGGNIDRGFYVYRLTARNEDGSVAKENSKLIYVK